MQRTRVNSSNISSIGYDNGYLEVEFNNGSIYIYSGVPASVYSALMDASSHGQYFNQNIKDRYTFTKR